MKKVFGCVALSFVLLALVSCVSNSGAKGAGKNLSYYESNAADFSEATLSNGIPVVYKKNSSGKIYVLRLIIDGGTPLVPVNKSGLEDCTLDMLQYGSESYAYEEIQQLKYERSFSITSNSGYDFSTYGFRCIEKYFDSAFDIFVDSLMHPLLSIDDFEKVKTEYAESVQRALTDPSSLLGLTMRKEAFAGHPYESNPSVTKESLGSITLDDVKSHYKTLLNANRLKIVVVGDFSAITQDKMTEKLEAAFGSIAAQPYEKPQIPALSVKGRPVHVPLEQAGDSGYAFGYFVCPERNDSSAYIPFALASMYVDEALFSQVREKNGAVYSAGTGIFGGKKLFGVISIYRASKAENLQKLIYEAIDSFPDERGVQEQLDHFKNKYITALFSTAQDSSGVAGNIVSSMQYYGDPKAYLLRTDRIQAVTAAQVLTAYRKYFARDVLRAADGIVNPIRWVVVDKDGRFSFGK